MLIWLVEPLGFEFMRNAIVTAILLGILSAVVGTYLIVQRMGLLGDVIAHAVLPGLAIAFFFGVDIFLGAFISGTLSTFFITWIQSQSRVKVDVAMALVFSGFLALGITLITLLRSKLAEGATERLECRVDKLKSPLTSLIITQFIAT